MPFNHDDARELLRTATGIPTCEFRDGQWEAIDAMVNQRQRALVVQSTSWGKSMVYFISTRLLRNSGAGPTIVVSPLLALMRNQVAAARRAGVRAVTLNSSNHADHPQILTDILANNVDLILVSPEKLANDQFVANYIAPITDSVGMLVVDEAHCISDWGHDFRPDYKRIVRILGRIPEGIPVLATTATANDRVVADVTSQLGDNVGVYRGPLIRSSLALDSVKIDDPAARLAWLTAKVHHIEGSGIVYVLTQRDTERVARWLQSQEIDAHAYHGGMDNDVRERLETALINNEVKCLVATSALGMGFDKSDLMFVIHYQAPPSVVDYYQQVGRAGRGVDQAYGYLIYGSEDHEINEHFRKTAFPPKYQIDSVIEKLEEADYGLSVPEIKVQLNFSEKHIKFVLKYLSYVEPAPVVKTGAKWNRTPHPFSLNEAQISHLTRQREIEWGDIVEYGNKRACLMKFLAVKLDDANPTDCGRCAVCTGHHLQPTDFDPAVFSEAQRFLNHSEFPLRVKKMFPNSTLGQDFEANNSKIPNECLSQEGRVMSRYGEPIIGELVKRGKRTGDFNDAIVDAANELIQNRWPEARGIEWVTCIPSLRHPDLVPTFASKLAFLAGIKFEPAVSKIKETYPQKDMENSYYQCANLREAFSVTIPDELIGKPVLLVDDMSDSGWTITIASYLLLKAGSGPVFPLALASSKPSG